MRVKARVDLLHRYMQLLLELPSKNNFEELLKRTEILDESYLHRLAIEGIWNVLERHRSRFEDVKEIKRFLQVKIEWMEGKKSVDALEKAQEEVRQSWDFGRLDETFRCGFVASLDSRGVVSARDTAFWLCLFEGSLAYQSNHTESSVHFAFARQREYVWFCENLRKKCARMVEDLELKYRNTSSWKRLQKKIGGSNGYV